MESEDPGVGWDDGDPATGGFDHDGDPYDDAEGSGYLDEIDPGPFEAVWDADDGAGLDAASTDDLAADGDEIALQPVDVGDDVAEFEFAAGSRMEPPLPFDLADKAMPEVVLADLEVDVDAIRELLDRGARPPLGEPPNAAAARLIEEIRDEFEVPEDDPLLRSVLDAAIERTDLTEYWGGDQR